MRRKYNKEEYYNKLSSIRETIPGIAITTDIIVGFPEETEEMFEEMFDYIIKCNFSEMHVFPYSKRSGTKAALIKGQINGIIKSMRVNRLIQLNENLATKYINGYKGKVISVLFESSDGEYTHGHSDTYITIKVPRDESLHNTIKNVIVDIVKYKDTLGKIKS